MGFGLPELSATRRMGILPSPALEGSLQTRIKARLFTGLPGTWAPAAHLSSLPTLTLSSAPRPVTGSWFLCPGGPGQATFCTSHPFPPLPSKTLHGPHGSHFTPTGRLSWKQLALSRPSTPHCPASPGPSVSRALALLGLRERGNHLAPGLLARSTRAVFTAIQAACRAWGDDVEKPLCLKSQGVEEMSPSSTRKGGSTQAGGQAAGTARTLSLHTQRCWH